MKQLFIILLLFISISLFGNDIERGYCLNFDGSNDFVHVVASIIPIVGDFTISVWVKADSNLPYDIREIVFSEYKCRRCKLLFRILLGRIGTQN